MDSIVPTQILFCLKEKNQRKINSHRWFFQAFCAQLKPSVCMLLDVGTRPGPSSIYRLWKTFDINRDVGGACGEVRAMTGKHHDFFMFYFFLMLLFRYSRHCTFESFGSSSKL